jgi:hypothetical protein
VADDVAVATARVGGVVTVIERWRLDRGLDVEIRPPTKARPALPRIRVKRVATWVIVGVLWTVAAYAVVLGVARVPPVDLGADYRFYVSIGQRWLDTGQLYPGELDGPYQFTLMRTNIYPPNELLLFLPFVWLPAAVWWIGPACVLGYALLRWRPRAWGWAVLALVVIWPRTVGAVLFGNTDLWIAALVAAGLLWGWPIVLLLIKPTFAPLMLLGVRRRSWWAGVGAMAVFAALTVSLWVDYTVAVRNAVGLGWDYSLGSLPLILVPVALWAARRHAPRRAGIDGLEPSPAAQPLLLESSAG